MSKILATLHVYEPSSAAADADEGEALIDFLNKIGQPGKKAGGATLPPDYTVSFVIGRFRYTYANGRWTRTPA